MRRLVYRLWALVRKRRLDHELDGEVRAHLELFEREAIANGMSPEEARRLARIRFGGVEQMKEEHRDRRSVRWIETLLRDFRYGLASLVRNPGFAIVAIAVLALGIGANTAMFSIVDAVLLKPLPFPEPDRIVRLWEAPRPDARNATSTPDFQDWRRLNNAFEAMAAEMSRAVALTGEGEPVRLDAALVTAEYFQVYGATALLGRTFAAGDDQPGADPTVVLSYAVWQNQFGGDPGILERRPIFEGEPHQVIGILPPGAFDRGRAKVWMPLVLRPAEQVRGFHWLEVSGRLRGGVTLDQATAEMARVYATMADARDPETADWTVVVEPLDKMLVGGNLRQSILIALGAVTLVLLIACANVANLLLARGAARRKEMAIRAALGASRGRLAAQLLTESSVLCLAGGAAGVFVAYLLLGAAAPMLPELVPYTADVRLDPGVLGFAASVALGVALLVGVLPSARTSFGRLAHSLNQASRGSSGAQAGLRRAIVVGEVALSLVLACGALLLFRSLVNLQDVDTGIRTDHIITMSADLPLAGYPTPERAALFYDALSEKLASTPGIEQAGLTAHLPLQWIGAGEGLTIPGIEEEINVRFKRVDPGYFETLDIPVLAGRGITRQDRAGAPAVIVINQALAAQLAEVAGITDPIGRTGQLSVPFYSVWDTYLADVAIVGVIRNELVNYPQSSYRPPVVYVPMAQAPWPYVRLVARTRGEPAAIVPAIREAVREVAPNLPLGDVATMEQVRERSLAGTSRPAWLIGAFAAVAALLAALGLYGVLAQSVTERRREIGIRMALGAHAGNVVTHVLRNALRLVVVGLVLGLAGAVALTRLMESLLFQVSPLDPLALVVACAAMVVVGLFASFVPARRAARVDPMRVLRDDG